MLPAWLKRKKPAPPAETKPLTELERKRAEIAEMLNDAAARLEKTIERLHERERLKQRVS